MHIATIFLAAFAALIASLSVWGLIQPGAIIRLIREMNERRFVTLAAGTRVLLAIMLWWAAPISRQPTVLKILAVVALLAAVAIVFAGKARAMRLVDWWTERGAGVLRVGFVLGVVFAAYLLWVVWPGLT